MEDIIAMLKEKAAQASIEMSGGEFALILTAACSACCDNKEGGNGTCPPPKLT